MSKKNIGDNKQLGSLLVPEVGDPGEDDFVTLKPIDHSRIVEDKHSRQLSEKINRELKRPEDDRKTPTRKMGGNDKIPAVQISIADDLPESTSTPLIKWGDPDVEEEVILEQQGRGYLSKYALDKLMDMGKGLPGKGK